jgi:hypothetical protein
MKGFPGRMASGNGAPQMKKFLILGIALFALAFGAGCGPVDEGAGAAEKDGYESDAEGAAKDEAMKDMGEGMVDGAKDMGEGMVDGAKDMGEGMKEGAMDMGEGMKEGAKDMGEGMKAGMGAGEKDSAGH